MSKVFAHDTIPMHRASFLSRRQRGGYVSVDELLQPDKPQILPTTNLDINDNNNKNTWSRDKVNSGTAYEHSPKRSKTISKKYEEVDVNTVINLEHIKASNKIQKGKFSTTKVSQSYLSDSFEILRMRDWDQNSPREVAVLDKRDEEEEGLTQQRANMSDNVLHDNREVHLHVDVCNSSEDGEIAILSPSSTSFTDDEQLDENVQHTGDDKSRPGPPLIRANFGFRVRDTIFKGDRHVDSLKSIASAKVPHILSSVPTNSSNFPGCLYLPSPSLKPYSLLMNSAGTSPALPRSARPSPLGLYPVPLMFTPNSKTPCPHTASKPLQETLSGPGFSPIRPVPTCNLIRPCFNPNINSHVFPTMVPSPHLPLPLRPLSNSDAPRRSAPNLAPQHLAQLWARNALNLRTSQEEKNNNENARSSRSSEPRRTARKRHLSTESNNSDEDPEDALERRRQANARERERVSNLNSGFENLRQVLPWMNHNRRVSKVDTLRAAIAYIGHLQQTLWDAEWATHLQTYSQSPGFSHTAFRSATMEPFSFQTVHPYSFIRPRHLHSFGPTHPMPTLSTEISAPGDEAENDDEEDEIDDNDNDNEDDDITK
ncbi:uncharacterized protein LOC117115531 [Anneissia japonica]|uniref:uncharacterized protein LOC117115531 n=1 Tax=Anneissia japonica TaxID=1529436 RepID=UPI0014259468|nr:uncharacterized protein LOC117115531 [Anneissia japonica]